MGAADKQRLLERASDELEATPPPPVEPSPGWALRLRLAEEDPNLALICWVCRLRQPKAADYPPVGPMYEHEIRAHRNATAEQIVSDCDVIAGLERAEVEAHLATLKEMRLIHQGWTFALLLDWFHFWPTFED